MELKIKVPTNLSEITLAQYKKYLKVIEANSEIDNAETFISLKMLEIFFHFHFWQIKLALNLNLLESLVLLKFLMH